VDAAWHKLEDLAGERFSNIPKSPGVYFVRWSRGGKLVPIHRLGGCDNKGILYIGSSKKDLRRRIREFWKAIGEKNVERHTIFATLAFLWAFWLSEAKRARGLVGGLGKSRRRQRSGVGSHSPLLQEV